MVTLDEIREFAEFMTPSAVAMQAAQYEFTDEVDPIEEVERERESIIKANIQEFAEMCKHPENEQCLKVMLGGFRKRARANK